MGLMNHQATHTADTPRPISFGRSVAWVRRLGLVPGIPLLLLLTIIVAGAFASLIAPHDPTDQNLRASNLPPAWLAEGTTDHLLGTDLFGRDQLSRIIHGARVSLIVSLTAIGIGGAGGTLLGLISGYLGGKVDVVLMRIVDILLAFPILLLAIVLASVLGASFTNVIIAVSLLLWPRFGRLVRAEVLSIRESDFVDYAQITGTSTPRVLAKHLFPNVIATLLVLTTWEVGSVILLESTLSFLGAGIPPPNPSWGGMVLDGRGLLATAWWLSFFPGLAILLTVLSLNLLGDWLRDWLDPKMRRV